MEHPGAAEGLDPLQREEALRYPGIHPKHVWFMTMALATGLSVAPIMPELPVIPARLQRRLGGAGPARLLLGVPVYLAGLLVNASAKRQIYHAYFSMASSGISTRNSSLRRWRSRRHMDTVGWGVVPPLCTGGVFQLTRNPIYIAALCLSTGAGLLANSACFLMASALPFFCYCQLVMCPREEALLLRLYGEQYKQYCAVVPRWLHLPHAGRRSQ